MTTESKGNWNPGNGNSGDWNSGDWNSGNWNSCNYETGYFNSLQSDDIRVFNKTIKRDEWNKAEKPNFILKIETCYWVDKSQMTDDEKSRDPDYKIRGGQLRKRTYKEAWKKAFDEASEKDIKLLKSLPNFDADVFEKITGVRIK